MEPIKPTTDPVNPDPNSPSDGPAPNTPSEMPSAVSGGPDTPSAPQALSNSAASGVTTPAASAMSGVSDSNGTASSPAAEPPQASIMPTPHKSGGKRWLIPTVAGVVAVLLLTGGYVFGFYLPNTPDAVYKSSLQKSGQALDALVQYTDKAADKKYKSSDFEGKLQAKTSAGSFDATLTGSLDEEMNATATLKANIMGEKLTADLRSVHVDGNTSPDVYLQLSGVKPMLDSYGLSDFDSLEGKWIGIDHTLVDTMVAAMGEAQLAESTSSPTDEQLLDAIAKVQAVNKQYIFTTDSEKAVLQQSSYVGKETKDGQAVHHYKVGYNKDHLLSYVTALGKALDESKLNMWSKSANSGQSLSEFMDLKGLKDTIRNAKSSYTFDLWIDAKTKLIRTVSFTDPSDVNSEFSLTQNYTGGDEYPFAMAVTGKENGVSAKMELSLTLNAKTDKISGKAVYDDGANSGSFTFSVTPSNEAIKVTAPANAEPIMHLLSSYGLDGAF